MLLALFPQIPFQRLAEEEGVFRIVCNAVNTADEAPVRLLQAVQDRMGRDNVTGMYLKAGEDAPISDFCTAVHIGDFKITVLSDFRTRRDNGIVSGALLHRTGNTAAPAEMAVLGRFLVHQAQDFLCGAEMDKFGRSQTEQLHTVRPQCLPYGITGREQFIRVITLRLFPVELFQRRVGRQRILKVPVQAQAYFAVDQRAVFSAVKYAAG